MHFWLEYWIFIYTIVFWAGVLAVFVERRRSHPKICQCFQLHLQLLLSRSALMYSSGKFQSSGRVFILSTFCFHPFQTSVCVPLLDPPPLRQPVTHFCFSFWASSCSRAVNSGAKYNSFLIMRMEREGGREGLSVIVAGGSLGDGTVKGTEMPRKDSDTHKKYENAPWLSTASFCLN